MVQHKRAECCGGTFTQWQAKAEAFLSKVHEHAGLRVSRGFLGRGCRSLIHQQISPCVTRSGRAGSLVQGSAKHSCAGRRKVKQVRRLQHLQVLISKGLRLQAMSLWHRIRKEGVGCRARGAAPESARQALHLFHTKFGDLSPDNVKLMLQFAHACIRSSEPAA